jgi:hypothetical protein
MKASLLRRIPVTMALMKIIMRFLSCLMAMTKIATVNRETPCWEMMKS